jgi:hypothetical protein
MVSMSRGPRPLFAASLALAAIVAGVSGCSSSDEASRDAGNLGTRICILNSWTETVSVQYTKRDTDTGTGPLKPGMQSCAEGTSIPYDVLGVMVFPAPTRALFFEATNPFFGAPWANISQAYVNDPPDPTDQRLANGCIVGNYEVGTTRLWDNGTMRISIKRLPDDQWKEFILIIEPSQGQRVGTDPCRD